MSTVHAGPSGFWLITGYTGCGKDTCAQALHDRFAFHVVSMSRFMAAHGFDHHAARSINESLRMRDEFLVQHPPEENVDFILGEMREQGALIDGKVVKPVVMAGLRTLPTFRILCERIPLVTIALIVDEEIRFSRICEKGRRRSDPRTHEEMHRLTAWENSRGQDVIVREADFHLDGNADRNHVREALFSIVVNKTHGSPSTF